MEARPNLGSALAFHLGPSADQFIQTKENPARGHPLNMKKAQKTSYRPEEVTGRSRARKLPGYQRCATLCSGSCTSPLLSFFRLYIIQIHVMCSARMTLCTSKRLKFSGPPSPQQQSAGTWRKVGRQHRNRARPTGLRLPGT